MTEQPPPISLRLPPRAREWMEEVTHEKRITRSDLMRCVINVARAHPEELDSKISDLS